MSTPTPEAIKLAERLEKNAAVIRSGKEWRFVNAPVYSGKWIEANLSPQFASEFTAYDAETRPEPRRVPYDFDSFPWPGKVVLFRLKRNLRSVASVTGKTDRYVYFSNESPAFSYEELSKYGELSLDNGATWGPASREVCEP